jgi:pimeloyl-ACP methyl ester carboxylesterase
MMANRTLVYLHGFSSSMHSAKALYLGRKLEAFPQAGFHAIDFNPTPTDFYYMTTTGLVNRVRQYVLDHDLEPFSIIGSSYGGLIAVHYAHRFGSVERMLLLAPGLRWLSGGLSKEQLQAWEKAGAVPVSHEGFQAEIPIRYDLQIDGLQYLEPSPPACPMVIIHGNHDTTVPTDDSRAYAAKYPDKVQLVEVDADHDLNGYLPLIWEYAQSFLLGISEREA